VALKTTSTTTKSGQGRQKLELKIDDADLRGLLRSFGKMDDIAKNDMKKIAEGLSRETVDAVKSAAASSGNPRQNLAVMESVSIKVSDKSPNFTIGGKDRVTSQGTQAGYMLTGAEFGSSKYKQFPSRSGGGGREGYFIFPTLKRLQPSLTAKWLDGYKLVRDAWKGRLG
jgi:hypothetical protein